MIHRGQTSPSSSSSCCSSSSSSCFSEKHDRPHLYYHITLWASIKKKGLLCLLGLAGMTNALRIVSPNKHTHTHTRTHTCADVHIPADHSSPICSVSKERCTGSTAGLSGLSDGISRVSLTSSVSLSKWMCCKIINHMLFSKSHLQCFKPSSHLPQVTPSEKYCLTKARGHLKYSVKYFVHPKKILAHTETQFLTTQHVNFALIQSLKPNYNNSTQAT